MWLVEMGSGQAHALTLYYIMIIYTMEKRIHNKTEIELKLWVKISAIKLEWLTWVLGITLNFYFIPLFYSSVSLNFIIPYTHSYTHSHIHTHIYTLELEVLS